MKIFAKLFGLFHHGFSYLVPVVIHGGNYIRRKQIPWSIESCVDDLRWFDVEEDEGVFRILGDDVFQAPRQRVRALLAFVHRHQYLPFLGCHRSRYQLLLQLLNLASCVIWVWRMEDWIHIILGCIYRCREQEWKMFAAVSGIDGVTWFGSIVFFSPCFPSLSFVVFSIHRNSYIQQSRLTPCVRALKLESVILHF